MKLSPIRPVLVPALLLAALAPPTLAVQGDAKPAPGALVPVKTPEELAERPSGGVPDSLRITLTPEQMREDVQAWRDGLEAYCAGLYRYVTEEQLDARFAELDQRLEQDLPLLVFYRELMKVAVELRHQRTTLMMPARLTSRKFGQQSNVMPLRVHVEGDRVFVLELLADATGVPPGSELLEVQGVPVAVLLQMMYEHMPLEGYADSSRARRTELGFPLHYLLFVDETLADYEVRFRAPDGEEATVVLTGVPGKAAFDVARPHTGKRLVEIEYAGDPEVAVLSLRSLYERDLKSDGVDLVPYIEAVLTEIESKGVDTLVLDLRGNGRGSDVHGVALVAHLVDEPFRYFRYVKTAPVYEGNQDVATRSDGTQVLFPYAGMGQQKPVAEPFLGKLVVLIDGGTYGAAADAAAVLHRLGRATFVGEPTGGCYDGSTIGGAHKVTLPNSELYGDMPMLDYELFGGDPDLFGLGVPPDHAVTWTGADRIAGRDTVREFVLGTLLRQ